MKYKADGCVERYKVRLVVVKDYTKKKKGIDCIETFSLDGKMTTVRSLIALAVKKIRTVSVRPE